MDPEKELRVRRACDLMAGAVEFHEREHPAVLTALGDLNDRERATRLLSDIVRSRGVITCDDLDTSGLPPRWTAISAWWHPTAFASAEVGPRVFPVRVDRIPALALSVLALPRGARREADELLREEATRAEGPDGLFSESARAEERYDRSKAALAEKVRAILDLGVLERTDEALRLSKRFLP